MSFQLRYQGECTLSDDRFCQPKKYDYLYDDLLDLDATDGILNTSIVFVKKE